MSVTSGPPRRFIGVVPTDAESALVERLRQGDAAAFDALFEAYRPRVFRFLLHLSGDRGRAEDLTQDTFVKLARWARRLSPNTRVAAWLFTVARNLYVSDARLRAESRWDELGDHAEPVDPLPTPFERVAAQQMAERLAKALAVLPATYRAVVLLVAVEGFAIVEAAEILGVRPEAARQRLSRGRAMLEEALAGRPRRVIAR